LAAVAAFSGYPESSPGHLGHTLVQNLGVKGVTADEPQFNTTHADFPQIELLRDWP
jgi:hypothetical protein